MVIIKTKVLNPTNTKGSRIKATANGMDVTIPYPHAKSHELAHYEAVYCLVEKYALDWDITRMGFGSDNDGYYFTFNSSIIEE